MARYSMSSKPPETETCTVDLTREERWVVHSVLAARADEVIDRDGSPPAWLVDLFDTIESGGRTITRRQAGKLSDALTDHVAADDTPTRDVEPALDVADRIDGAF